MTADPTEISAQPPPEKSDKDRLAAATSDGPPPVVADILESLNETKSGNPAIEAARTLGKTALEGKPEKHIETSKGERLFDWMAYGGFAGVVTFLLSIPLGYWSRYSKSGIEATRWGARHLKKVGLSRHTAEDAAVTTGLMQGGNLMVIPVKIMEDQKPQLVSKFNRYLGDTTGALSVEDEPKQSWTSLIKSRLLAWTTVFVSLRAAASMIGKDNFNAFEEKFSEHLVCGPLKHPTHIAGRETRLFRVGKIAAIDVFATAAAATLLYIGSRFFAQGSEKWRRGNGKPEEPEKAEEPASAAPPETPPEKCGTCEAAGDALVRDMQALAGAKRHKPLKQSENFADRVREASVLENQVVPH